MSHELPGEAEVELIPPRGVIGVMVILFGALIAIFLVFLVSLGPFGWAWASVAWTPMAMGYFLVAFPDARVIANARGVRFIGSFTDVWVPWSCVKDVTYERMNGAIAFLLPNFKIMEIQRSQRFATDAQAEQGEADLATVTALWEQALSDSAGGGEDSRVVTRVRRLHGVQYFALGAVAVLTAATGL